METWKQIAGNENYQVSTLGSVRSLYRTLKPIALKNKYLKVELGRRGRQALIHRLVAEAFIPNPESKRTVNHKNGTVSDNRLENLEWATYSENHKHAFAVLGRKGHATSGSYKKGHPHYPRKNVDCA